MSDTISYDDLERQKATIVDIRKKQAEYRDRRLSHTPTACIRCGQPAILTDKRGNKWCEAHRMRYELLSWGHSHNFPAYNFDGLVSVEGEVRPAKYAVGEGYPHWYLMCGVGDNLYIECMHHAAFPSEDEDLELSN